VVLERRQERDECVVEPGELVRGVLLEDAEIDEQADDRLAGPVVRTAQDTRLEDPEGGCRAGRDARRVRVAVVVRAIVSATGLLLSG